MKELDFKSIGQKIRETRITEGLTQDYLAKVAKVNVSHISNIENNRVKISLPTLVAVCNALSVTVDYILSDEYTSDLSPDNEILRKLSGCTPAQKEKILKMIDILRE
ncbi:MAG: helix-turn-helix transcriptional regulator [Lachnospiraceae bacterium]|nr:helix-turn-helix transcriptional regulator [Lachnospiraceae bacterium]